MSLGTDGVPFTMNVEPAGSGSNNNGGWGGDWGAWIILFLIFGMFGWGGMGFGGGFGGFGGMGGGAYPAESILQRSLDTQTIIGKLDGVNQGLCDGFYAQSNAINGLGMNMMQGFHGVDNAICNLGYTTQQGFNATQVAMMQGQNALQAQLSDCCCTTQRSIDGVKFTIAQEDCATRNLMQSNTRDLIENQNSNARAILDALTAQRIEAKDQRIAEQAAQIQALQLSASQAAQNATLRAAMEANTAEILRKTGAECPMPAYVVQPPQPVTFPTNCCGQASYAGGNCGGCCA